MKILLSISMILISQLFFLSTAFAKTFDANFSSNVSVNLEAESDTGCGDQQGTFKCNGTTNTCEITTTSPLPLEYTTSGGSTDQLNGGIKLTFPNNQTCVICYTVVWEGDEPTLLLDTLNRCPGTTINKPNSGDIAVSFSSEQK